ncbi:MAG TPA: YibE/F family protein [Candidatus Limnocylindrales bacterium]
MTEPIRDVRGLGAGLRRNGLALAVGGLLLAGLWLLPDLAPPPSSAAPVDLFRGRLVERLDPGVDGTGPDARVQILDGSRKGETLDAYLEGPSGQQQVPLYEPGDEVIVSVSGDNESGTFVAVSDRWRIPTLALLVGIFALGVTVVGGWRGVRSLLALALTLGVVVRIVVPLLLAGWDPIPLAIVAATGVTLVTLVLTEGLRPATFAAAGGTFAALALTGFLASTFNALARFTELQGQGDLVFLQNIGVENLDLGGLLLAAVMLGALGVLDDVTVTQAAAVQELHEADPGAPRARLFGRAMNVGRSHIAATVNTLVLAYVGASLPLLVLFAAGHQDPLLISSGEIVAVEVVRAIVGSIGIVAAVPLTTIIAVMFIEPPPG